MLMHPSIIMIVLIHLRTKILTKFNNNDNDVSSNNCSNTDSSNKDDTNVPNDNHTNANATYDDHTSSVGSICVTFFHINW